MSHADTPAPKELAALLCRPHGKLAAEVGRRMNQSNAALNMRCIELLDLQTGNAVLEVGPGNAAFAVDIVNGADGVSYTGLDWSAAMVGEARVLNEQAAAAGRMRFHQGSTDALPFEPASFDRVLGVHVAYFWDDPARHLADIRRVMRPDALLCLAVGDRAFMQVLPFTAHGFRLYTEQEMLDALSLAGFEVPAVEHYKESGASNAGEYVDKRVNVFMALSSAM